MVRAPAVGWAPPTALSLHHEEPKSIKEAIQPDRDSRKSTVSPGHCRCCDTILIRRVLRRHRKTDQQMVTPKAKGRDVFDSAIVIGISLIPAAELWVHL